MLDRRFIRENPEVVKNAARAKGVDLDIDELLHLDQLTRKLQFEVDEAQARRKAFSKQFAKANEVRRAQMRAEHEDFDQQLRELRERLAETSARLHNLLLLTPGIPWDGAPVGDDESANVTIKTQGERPIFEFEPLDHVDLIE